MSSTAKVSAIPAIRSPSVVIVRRREEQPEVALAERAEASTTGTDAGGA